MKIKLKKLDPNAKMPTRGTKYAAGFDLYAAEEFDAPIFEEQTVRIQTGLAFEIPEGYVGVVYSRSSTALKGLIITPLLVDADYRGPGLHHSEEHLGQAARRPQRRPPCSNAHRGTRPD